MSEVTLFCADTPGLKLGPGVTHTGRHQPGEVIVFDRGYATFDAADFPDWPSWAYASGTPTILVVGDDEPTSADQDGVECSVCGKRVKSDFALRAHLRVHAPKAEKPSAKGK